MDYFLSAVFLLFWGPALSQWTGDDGRNEGIRCFEQIIYDGDITNLLIDVTTPETIDDFCRRHSALQKCTRENEHYMTVEENTGYLQKTSGVHNFFVNVCPPGTDITADYKGNAPCFKLIRNEILSCGSDLPDINSFKMKTDLRTRCCALKNHRECLMKVTSEYCGKEASSVVDKILLRFFDRKIKECNATSYRCNESGHSTLKYWPPGPEWNKHTPNWRVPDERNYKHSTEKEDWKTTDAGQKVDWKHTPEADLWKKHKHHHSGGMAVAFNCVISVFSCIVAILLHKL